MKDSQPYPWPFDGGDAKAIDASRTMVLACGMQQHWLDLAMQGAEATAVHICDFVDRCRVGGVAVMWIRHGRARGGHRSIDRTLPAVGSEAWSLIALPEPDDIVIDTPGHDAFLVGWTDVELRGRGVDKLVLVGIGTETTVNGTLRSANDRGFECVTLTDAVAHHGCETGAAALSSITMSGGIFGAIGTTVDLLRELESRAQPTDKGATYE